MSNRKRGLALSTGAVALAGLVAFSLPAFAASSDTSLAERLAGRFHLNRNDVQQVIDQQHTERAASRESRYEARLTQAVKDGKLTSNQHDLVLAKHKELAAFIQSLKGKTPQERRDAIKAKRDELKTWEQQNGVPTGYLGSGGLRGGGHLR